MTQDVSGLKGGRLTWSAASPYSPFAQGRPCRAAAAAPEAEASAARGRRSCKATPSPPAVFGGPTVATSARARARRQAGAMRAFPFTACRNPATTKPQVFPPRSSISHARASLSSRQLIHCFQTAAQGNGSNRRTAFAARMKSGGGGSMGDYPRSRGSGQHPTQSPRLRLKIADDQRVR